MQIPAKQITVRKMHAIVLAKVGVFSLFAISFVWAMVRVSQIEKFKGSYVKSLPPEITKLSGELPDAKPVVDRAVVPASTSSNAQPAIQSMPVSAGSPEAQTLHLSNQTAEITSPVELEALTRTLYDQLDRSWQTSPTFEHNLVYRVSVRADGAIVRYEALNQPAKDYVQETPLPVLLPSPRVEISSHLEPAIGRLTVVFSPTGILEVSP